MPRPSVKLRILIADDQELVRRGIRSLLEGRREWIVCGEAATAGDTIEKVRKLHPDVLLLGVRLPDMDAAEAIPEIMDGCPTTKIIALAMHDSGEQAAGALAAGAVGLALKSDAANDLLLTLQNIARNQPFFSPAALRVLQCQLAKNRTPGATPTDLTAREIQVLKLLASGESHKEVGGTLKIRVKTVDAHRANIMRKLKLVRYSDLIQFAIRHKLIEM